MCIKRIVLGVRALACLAILAPGLLWPARYFNLYIRLVDFTGLVWVLGLQPYNYPYFTLALRPLYLLLPKAIRARLKEWAKRKYRIRWYYRDID